MLFRMDSPLVLREEPYSLGALQLFCLQNRLVAQRRNLVIGLLQPRF